MSEPVIQVENLGKQYRIGQRERYLALRDVITEAVKSPFRFLARRGQENQDTDNFIWALKDVSFEVQCGEVLGIIGKNGAGKSTLLKVLSQITEPTEGHAIIHGRVASLLEIGTGFHPELTGRENIFLNGAILGMSRKEIQRKFDEIVTFSEMERFLDTPVKRYSSGMYVRLAFAVAAHMEPEILLVDEVLAVGDAGFQKKCLGKMGDVARGGRTILFVSHNMGAINQLCPKSIWINEGRIVQIGDTASIVSSYIRQIDAAGGLPEVEFPELLFKDAQLRRARLLDNQGKVTQKFLCDEPIVLELLLDVRRILPGFYGYMECARSDGTVVLMSDSFDSPPNPMDSLPVGFHTVRITIPARTLAAGDYTIHLNFPCPSAKIINVDSPGIICSFRLDDTTSRRGNNRPGFFSTMLKWELGNSPPISN